MQDFERLGVFYLGRSYDWHTGRPAADLLLYDSRDLVTHAVCVGMTGSGKTGLGIVLLEEAAIDGIPAIVIDPKGDMANLLLTFPGLRAEDFAPWVQEEDARLAGLSTADFAARQAEAWSKGLAQWGQEGGRIQRLRDSADFAVYTPGSTAGTPVSILKSFAAPSPATRDDDEALRDLVQNTASSLLGLMGLEADPLKSREHILLSTLLNAAWREGRDSDLGTLIRHIQSPPVERIGVLDLETFYPAKERFSLAMSLNNLLAAPGFQAWMEGEPLDSGRLLYSPTGKPRISILSIAHLSEAERMLFVSLLLNQVLCWMRSQSGTTSLRALLYMDEIFGYFPPVADPPSKKPLLTLLKQARAFGLGVVLATQNPVDLDYKGLANAGTWFIGRLQTERDKARLLDGLEGAAAGTGAGFDRRQAEEALSGLGKRVFLMNNVHEQVPVVFETRWALSYLRGPLTRQQLRKLCESAEAAAPAAAAPPPSPQVHPAAPPPLVPVAAVQEIGSMRPVLPPDVPQVFVPIRGAAADAAPIVYQPRLLGSAQIRFSDTKARIDHERQCAHATLIGRLPVAASWEQAEALSIDPAELESAPGEDARFEEPAAAASDIRNYKWWTQEYQQFLSGSEALELLRSPGLKEMSQPGESEREFRIRLQQRAREERDVLSESLRNKYAPKIQTLQERLRRAEQAVEREAEQAKQQKYQTAISFGTTVLAAFLGRKTLSASTIGRATTAARGVSRSVKEAADVGRAQETVAAIRSQLEELVMQFREETEMLQSRVDPLTEKLDTMVIRPKKTGISIRMVSLAWFPFRVRAGGMRTPAWK